MANITIVSTGGTRAPSQLELADRFLADGHQVRCIATKNALRFLSSHIARNPHRLSFYTRMYRPQLMETFAYYNDHPRSVPHVSEGKWADVVVMCPASCNSVGKLAAGMNDNYALLVVRAVPRTKRVIVVPSMNPEMWFDPQFQRNVDLLNATEKYRVVCPSRGLMLSGDWGFGAQASLEDIVAETYRALGIVSREVESVLARRFAVPWEQDSADDGELREIVLVDEDDTLREQLAAELLRNYDGFSVRQFRNPGQAIAALADFDPALIVTELTFTGGAPARDLIDRFRRPGGDNPVQIIATGEADRREAGAEALARRDIMYLPKPLNVEFTLGMIAGCLQGGQRATPVQRLTLAAGEVLFREGAEDDTIYIVESGNLRIVKQVEGLEVELGIVGPDGLLGELAFLSGSVRTATAIADEATVVHAVQIGDARDHLDREPLWMRSLVETLVQRVLTRDDQAVEVERSRRGESVSV
ncbi:MAG TPA: flavoprotein [Thermoleophilaceae bacterium]|jgi:ActR/RegA family two-component response regulator/3-polyprenyl-4-hydroxybenzoate decarboxylase|nr:flavoprotein [Thermoleophilaceae bacterium]